MQKLVSILPTIRILYNFQAKQTTTDRVPPLGGYVWPPDQIPGVTGLKNHGR